jgi:tetratricopeptide (TPR) repeat protein
MKLFISHSPKDDRFVRDLRMTLADHGQDGWIDSRELRGGDGRWLEIQRGIEAGSAYAVVVSPAALQSSEVGKELRHALKVRDQRGKENFPVIPLSLDGTGLGLLEEFFGEAPVYLPVSSGPGGVEAAADSILAALRLRKQTDVAATPQPKAEPLEDLVLELTDLTFREHEGTRRAMAHARLVYQPATAGQPPTYSAQKCHCVAPLGPIEKEELRWYLEQYAVWPSGVTVIQDRARKVEANLIEWGKRLHEAAMPVSSTANVMQAWAGIDGHSGRRFSVQVDETVVAGATDAEVMAAKEAATLLLGLPWELLHDGTRFLFQGALPTRVRRRLPNLKSLGVPVVAPPIRILLITARPEDDSCDYIDHRASALPLVEAMESLPGLVHLHVLAAPTLSALSDELDRARAARGPYHVVHFDGHGVYDKQAGLGGLCFELAEDVDNGKLENRRHVTVFTDELGPLLHDHRIPLVFLEACQTAQAEKVSGSVASELLKVGVASVVAMSHSVLVETAGRFVETFYQSLSAGKRVGDAMLAGQRRLKSNTSRGRVFGAADLRLEDWFVPVLFQEKDDPQLFTETPAKQTVEDFKARLAERLGKVPPQPDTGFLGRSRELLALERLLRRERYAVVRGQGGEGKTALVAEFARWMVRSHQMRRAAFVSVEGLEKNIAESVLNKLGAQLLVKEDFSTRVDYQGDVEKAAQEIERVLREQPTLLVIDNMESILLPPWTDEATPQGPSKEVRDALSEEAREELDVLLALCARLLKAGETRLVFTTREPLPAPFNAARNQRELHQLAREDAVKLVERALNAEGGADAAGAQAAREQIEQLVEAVHCHARTLALLAPAVRARGVEATRQSLVALMVEMEKKFPGSREQSVFASVELSLRRLSEANRERARALGVFHGAVDLGVLRVMMGWETSDVTTLAVELLTTGLATLNPYNHLTLNPALCPYLRGRMDEAERKALTARWVEAMHAFVIFLVREQYRDIEIASTLTVLELSNLFTLLHLVQDEGNAEETIALASSLYALLQALGKPRLVDRIGQVRDAAVKVLGESWSHTRFVAAANRVEQQLGAAQVGEALEGAQQLLQRARAVGEGAYDGADYDLGSACCLLAQVLRSIGGAAQALSLLDEGQQRFEAIENAHPGMGAARMATVCLAERGSCLNDTGHFDEAATVYEEVIRRAEQHGDHRTVAVNKGQLGSVRLNQRRYADAHAAFIEARDRFTKLDDPGSVAVAWHQIGMVCERAGQPEAAEDAYRKSLAIEVQLGNVDGQAKTLCQLGNLYDEALKRPEEAVAFYRQAIDLYVETGAGAKEGVIRNNLADSLRKIGRLDEARDEIRRALECKLRFGHAARPWSSWAILASIETAAGNSAAAATAKGNAIASYLAYRRDGGENHFNDGRIAFFVTQSLLAGKASEVTSELREVAGKLDASSAIGTFIRILEAIVAGSRDRALADTPELDHTMAAEVLFLIETLESAGTARQSE